MWDFGNAGGNVLTLGLNVCIRPRANLCYGIHMIKLYNSRKVLHIDRGGRLLYNLTAPGVLNYRLAYLGFL